MEELSYHKAGNHRIVCSAYMIAARERVKNMNKKQLFVELENIQGRGITIFLEGRKSTPKKVSDVLCVQEDSSYMRDYVYEEGVLKELHFDKVRNE